MKRPAFQFYPADWRNDTPLQSCTVGARGLWIEMMCLMHEGEPYGYLTINGDAMQPAQLARMVRASERDVKRWLQELGDARVYSTDEHGRIFSRRMVSDERVRNARAEGGKLGGNPALMGKVTGKDGAKVNHASNVGPTPSSSASSSSSASPSGERHIAPSAARLDAGGTNGHDLLADPVVQRIPLRDGTDFEVRQSFVAELAPLFPAVDVLQTLREIRAWNFANKARRKTRSGIEKHVTGWIAKAQRAAAAHVHRGGARQASDAGRGEKAFVGNAVS